MSSLYEKSLEIIKQGQSESGAYIACPNFPTYHFSWLRDGSFIAHAMDTAGEYASAEAFFLWVGKTIEKYGSKVEAIRKQLKAGLPLNKDDVLYTRYTLDGNESDEDKEWGNFQIDGYGTWLWGLAEHIRLSGNTDMLKTLLEPIKTTLNYLELVWQLPNYDCWEEHPEYLHPYSLATVYAGFDSMARLADAGRIALDPLELHQLAEQVQTFILNYAVSEGGIVKHAYPENGNGLPKPVIHSGVDSSLLGLLEPYHVLNLGHPIMRTTLENIIQELHRPDGGVYRYKKDVYYGGGEWILLTAWLGWCYVKNGQVEQAKSLRAWIESQADANGYLAEQISDNLLFPDHYQPWKEKWGPVATPLLWSHAMYIILCNAIQEVDTP
jgi:GH15 family glucan-1,4-alpha-glucosidase